jgi:hypothetical protein
MAPLAAEHGDPELRMAVRVSKASHPYLADHAIGGVPVVPVVLAAEWFARVASALRPDLQLAAVNDVKVLRGIKLSGFESDGDWFEVIAREASNGTGALVTLELRGAKDALH